MFITKRKRAKLLADQQAAERIDDLRFQIIRAWATRSAMLRTSLMFYGYSFAMLILRMLVFEVVPFNAAVDTVIVVMAVTFGVVGMVFTVLSFRWRFKAENLNEEILRIDPSRRMITSHAEELGRSIRADLDRRKGTR